LIGDDKITNDMANKHGQNARLGAIGESYVQMRLMQKGWDAFKLIALTTIIN
jgi:hypothetical protein